MNLADALSACQFSNQLSSDDKEWATEQLVKLLIFTKEESSTLSVHLGEINHKI